MYLIVDTVTRFLSINMTLFITFGVKVCYNNVKVTPVVITGHDGRPVPVAVTCEKHLGLQL